MSDKQSNIVTPITELVQTISLNTVNEELGNSSQVRLMKTGDWAIPYSVSFTFDKISDFVPEEVEIRVQFSLRIAFKLTGLPEILKIM